jgi:serine protease Do
MKSDQHASSRSEGFAARRREALLVLLAVVVLTGGSAVAQTPTVVVNGCAMIPGHPVINQAGVVLLPMRELCMALGATVQWYPQERKIELRRGEMFVELWVMTPVAHVNHSPVQLASPPLLREGVTYLPLRLVGQAFGCAVQWDAATRTVSVVAAP